MAENHVLIRTIDIGEPVASVSITNIPSSGFTDLKLYTSLRSSSSSPNWCLLSINGGSDTAIDMIHIIGEGNSAASQAYSSGRMQLNPSTATANAFAHSETYISNYLSSTTKPMFTDGSQEGAIGNLYYTLAAQRWTGTTAINSLTFTVDSGLSFAVGSSFSLYGIADTSKTPEVSPQATGGNIIVNDGEHWYHAFLNSGTFTPSVELSCEIMAVGGGGGGGGNIGGGGGAGEIELFASNSVVLGASDYSILVGARGPAGGSNQFGGDGTFSRVSGSGITTITALGGGGGGCSGSAGRAGGSGGGGAPTLSPGAAGGSASGSNTNAGGTGLWNNSTGNYAGGGGGGATAAGGNGSGSTGGNGGQGYALSGYLSTLFSTMTHFASGGGGVGEVPGSSAGTGGTGGGGAGNGGGWNINATSATSYGSGGGGGNWESRSGGAGGAGYDGIVIIRYAS